MDLHTTASLAGRHRYSVIDTSGDMWIGGVDRPLLTREMPVEEEVNTKKGKIIVARQGNPSNPALLTFPDLGLNYLSNYHAFFNTTPSMSTVLDNFCIYHVTAPGQESGADDLPEDVGYPTLDEMSEQVECVMHHFGLTSCVGFGCGLGANVLVRLAKRRPKMVEGLILVNCNSRSASLVEWLSLKVLVKSLRKQRRVMGLPERVTDHLVWYHFGSSPPLFVTSAFRQMWSSDTNPRNLGALLNAYIHRSDLGLSREISTNGKPLFGSVRSLQMPVLNMTGSRSPNCEATVTFNGRLQPHKCIWLKISDAGMILDEQPDSVAQAFKLFLLRLGYHLKPNRPKQNGQESASRKSSS